jgi:N-[(2S)-2-amino-2-carboxyethyl]-L-glutamate dehydrogenase
MFPFSVVPGSRVRRILSASRSEVVEAVRRAYLLHHEGDAVNPPSQFLRFPDKPSARIIGLPAYLGGEYRVAGMKWIASFPANVAENLPRASAVLLLNDYDTGYPFACLEASQISAARTAASAVLGAEQLAGDRRLGRIAFVGCGIIARNILEYMVDRRWAIDCIAAHDTTAAYAESFASFAHESLGLAAHVASGLTEAVAGADVVVLATTAATPYIRDRGIFAPGQVVLNISLRDIYPVVIAGAHNIVDDVDHCLTAGTSVHLTEQALGSRDFVDGTLAQLMVGDVQLGSDRPLIFSPFGLGVLDLAVGLFVYRAAVATHAAEQVADFFAETTRWNQNPPSTPHRRNSA